MSYDSTFNVAQELLNTATSSLVCLDHEPPNIRYVGLCIPPMDCEQLVVYMTGIEEEIIEENPECAATPFVTYTIEVHRCISRSKDILPTPSERTAAAMQTHRDAWLLWSEMTTIVVEAVLEANLPDDISCSNIIRSPWECLAEQGLFTGGKLQFRIQLEGIGCI